MSVSKNLTSVGVFTDFLEFRHKRKPHFSQSTGPNVLATRDSEICDGEVVTSQNVRRCSLQMVCLWLRLSHCTVRLEFDRSLALQSERGEGEERGG